MNADDEVKHEPDSDARETQETLKKTRAREAKQTKPRPAAQRERFIAALRNSANVRAAAQASGISRAQVYRWRETMPTFAADWDEALDDALDVLEAAAWQRAQAGVLEPVYQQGEKVGEVRRYSDTLLIFLLKANRPKKYRDTYRVEATGADGGPMVTKNESLTDSERIEQLTAILDTARARAGGQDSEGAQPESDPANAL